MDFLHVAVPFLTEDVSPRWLGFLLAAVLVYLWLEFVSPDDDE